MKIIQVAFAGALLVAAGSASAAPADRWMGAYYGISAGGGWGVPTINDLKDAGGFFGGQVGFNLALGSSAVLGVETDAVWSAIRGTNLDKVPIKWEENWLGTVRGRFGFAFGSMMPYFTGGFAWTSATYNQFVVSQYKYHSGYVLGGGLEVSFSPRVSGKIEYQYLHLGAETYDQFGPPTPLVSSVINTVRVGMNVKLR